MMKDIGCIEETSVYLGMEYHLSYTKTMGHSLFELAVLKINKKTMVGT